MSVNFLSMTSMQFYASGKVSEVGHMLKVRVSAVIAAVLLMSSVSAQAMEFADRPEPISEAFNSPAAVRAIPSDDHSRRQINNPVVLLPVIVAETKLTDRPRPVSNVIPIKVSHSDRPGRLSAEFTKVARGSGIRFEYGPGVVASWLQPATASTALKFENRPGPVSNHFNISVAASIKFADRDLFTSSLPKSIAPYEIHARSGSLEFCVGSMAPCGVLSFAQQL